MPRFEFGNTMPRGAPRGFEVWEHDGSVSGRSICAFAEGLDAERIAALLNATVPGGAGGSMAALADAELEALGANATRELARRDADRAGGKPTAPDTGNDTLDALDPAGKGLTRPEDRPPAGPTGR